MIRFYAPDIATNFVLPEEESKHCVRVLRHKPGDEIYVIDGKGNVHRCVITDANPRKVEVRIIASQKQNNHWSGKITIAIAPPKNTERLDWFVEKAVEIGIDEIIPVRCEHSERKDLKNARIEKIAVSAMKQSLKASKPEIHDLTSFKDVVKHCNATQRFIAYCNDETQRILLSKAIIPSENTIILIGPEGDFSPTEVRLAIENGFIPVTLGESRLRTETAALVALDTFHIVTQLET